MGQQANGILYGCECPKLPNDEDGEGLSDLVCRWEAAQGISWLERDKPAIRHEHEGGVDLLGVWVAVGGSGEDGAPYFLENSVRFAEVEKVFKARITAAKSLWKRFAAWVKKTDGITLHSPELWLTPCETA